MTILESTLIYRQYGAGIRSYLADDYLAIIAHLSLLRKRVATPPFEARFFDLFG